MPQSGDSARWRGGVSRPVASDLRVRRLDAVNAGTPDGWTPRPFPRRPRARPRSLAVRAACTTAIPVTPANRPAAPCGGRDGEPRGATLRHMPSDAQAGGLKLSHLTEIITTAQRSRCPPSRSRNDAGSALSPKEGMGMLNPIEIARLADAWCAHAHREHGSRANGL